MCRAATAVRRDRLPSPRLELDEPPAWAVQRGAEDEVLRALDRLDWGGPGALQASHEVLERHAGSLAPLVLPRLKGLGPDRAVLASKLIEVLGNEDPATPGLLDTLIDRARSPSGLEAKAALRVLAESREHRALDGILPRLMAPISACAASRARRLAQVARRGDLARAGRDPDHLEGQPQDPIWPTWRSRPSSRTGRASRPCCARWSGLPSRSRRWWRHRPAAPE